MCTLDRLPLNKVMPERLLDGTISSVASSASSPRSIEHSIISKRFECLSPQRRTSKEALKESGGMIAKIEGYEVKRSSSASGGTTDRHLEFCIETQFWHRMGDAGRGLAPRELQAREEDERVRVVARSHQCYSAFRRLHDKIGRELGLHNAPKHVSNLLKEPELAKIARAAKLTVYLNDALAAAMLCSSFPPALLEFLGIDDVQGMFMVPSAAALAKLEAQQQVVLPPSILSEEGVQILPSGGKPLVGLVDRGMKNAKKTIGRIRGIHTSPRSSAPARSEPPVEIMVEMVRPQTYCTDETYSTDELLLHGPPDPLAPPVPLESRCMYATTTIGTSNAAVRTSPSTECTEGSSACSLQASMNDLDQPVLTRTSMVQSLRLGVQSISLRCRALLVPKRSAEHEVEKGAAQQIRSLVGRVATARASTLESALPLAKPSQSAYKLVLLVIAVLSMLASAVDSDRVISTSSMWPDAMLGLAAQSGLADSMTSRLASRGSDRELQKQRSRLVERPRRPELPRVAMHAALLASATALATASASATASPVSALLAAGSRARALFMPLAPALSAAAAGPPSWPALAMAVGVGALAKDAIKHISVRVARQHAGVRVLAGAAGAAGGMASGGVTFGGMAAGGKEAISMLARDLVVRLKRDVGSKK